MPFAALALPGATLAQTPGWHLIPSDAVSPVCIPYCVSSDGRIVAGDQLSSSFVWTEADGRVDLSFATPPAVFQSLTAMNTTGTIVAGSYSSTHIAYWRGPGTYTRILNLAGTSNAKVTGVSDDGNVIVGYANTTGGGGYRPFRWTPATGNQLVLPPRPDATEARVTGLTPDGRTMIGDSFTLAQGQQAFVWTEGQGYRQLPSLGSRPSDGTLAYDVTPDGRYVAVYDQGVRRGVLWGPSGAINLGPVPGASYSIALCVRDDGGLVLAEGSPSSGASHGYGIWTPDRGMELFTDYIQRFGLSIPASITGIEEITSMSGDGQTFVGYGRGQAPGTFTGFVLTVPSPSGMGLLAVTLAVSARRRRR